MFSVPDRLADLLHGAGQIVAALAGREVGVEAFDVPVPPGGVDEFGATGGVAPDRAGQLSGLLQLQPDASFVLCLGRDLAALRGIFARSSRRCSRAVRSGTPFPGSPLPGPFGSLPSGPPVRP